MFKKSQHLLHRNIQVAPLGVVYALKLNNFCQNWWVRTVATMWSTPKFVSETPLEFWNSNFRFFRDYSMSDGQWHWDGNHVHGRDIQSSSREQNSWKFDAHSEMHSRHWQMLYSILFAQWQFHKAILYTQCSQCNDKWAFQTETPILDETKLHCTCQ